MYPLILSNNSAKYVAMSSLSAPLVLQPGLFHWQRCIPRLMRPVWDVLHAGVNVSSSRSQGPRKMII